jgi:hypothetical protein
LRWSRHCLSEGLNRPAAFAHLALKRGNRLPAMALSRCVTRSQFFIKKSKIAIPIYFRRIDFLRCAFSIASFGGPAPAEDSYFSSK